MGYLSNYGIEPMTRINLECPSLLCREHLVGEWYENPRIASNIIKAHGKVDLKSAPKSFTVRTEANPRGGEGHMKFFYDKLIWLRRRYVALMEEMRRRGYNPSDNWKGEIFGPQYRHLFNDWEPSQEEISLSRTRIAEMMPAKNDLNETQLDKLSGLHEYKIIFKR